MLQCSEDVEEPRLSTWAVQITLSIVQSGKHWTTQQLHGCIVVDCSHRACNVNDCHENIISCQFLLFDKISVCAYLEVLS